MGADTRPGIVVSVATSGDLLQWHVQLHDRVRKLAVYARECVAHAWLVNPLAHTLEVLRLEGERWVVAASHGDEETVRAEPFEAVAIELPAVWGE